MIFSVEPIHIIWIAGLALTLLGALVGIAKWLLGQFGQRMDERFSLLAEDAKAWRQQEIKLMELRSHVSENYVRREDWIRSQSVVEVKLDALAAKLELMQAQASPMRGTSHER